MKKGLIAFIVLLLVTLFVFIIQPFLSIKKEASVLMTSAREMKDVFSKNDIDLLNKKVKAFSEEYKTFENKSKSVYWLSFIPHIADFKNGVEAGHYLVEAAQTAVVSITPYADLLGFKKGEASFVEKTAEGRLQTAVLTLDKVLKNVDGLSENIHQAEIRIEKINPNRYPKKLGKTEVRSMIINLKEQFRGMNSLFVDAKPLLKRIPEILGSKGEMTYLVLFQNDKELRATGGFLTFYTVFKVKNGKILVDRSDDIYSLDATIANHPKAPKEILTYHKNVTTFNLRDSNLSPDFVESVKLFNSLYDKSGAKVNYDGIIAVDTKILVDLLTIFGDTKADGIMFSSKTDKRCDCPQVIYTLFDIVDRPVGYVKVDRKGILGRLMYELLYKALGFSPSKYWGTLFQTMYGNLQEKHILMYFKDKEIQNSIKSLRFAGTLYQAESDYLNINNVNFAGAKSNLFVTEKIESKTEMKNGQYERQVTINYRNPYPHSDCNLEHGDLCLNATLRNWLRVYVPKGSELVEFKGSQKTVNTFDELGKTVFEGYLEVPTEGMASVTIKYKLPKSLNNNYSLYYEKQPGTYNKQLKVMYNNKTVFDGKINTDREFSGL